MVKTEEGVVVWPDPVLDSSSKPVVDFDESLEKLLETMTHVMNESEGIGIAASQIGVALNVAIVGRGDGTFFEVINPEILSADEPITLGEGCLSVPGEHEDVPRFRRVKVRYQDKTGEWHEVEAEDKMAHVLQHEIDHLQGTVYVKRLSQLKRSLIRQRMSKLQRAIARETRQPTT